MKATQIAFAALAVTAPTVRAHGYVTNATINGVNYGIQRSFEASAPDIYPLYLSHIY